ncbi:MAG TPA: metal ABC transporter ATP-binding protein [Acidimicrobiales bacterium]|nr:metal ABC transporter ATP-binding protein [Acidimicrobiales bacterium]
MSVVAAPANEVLSVEDLGVWLSGRQVLDGVTFSVRSGGLAGIIGPNGAGKTTLLRAILGLQRPGSGRVLVLGRSHVSRRHSPIGYVPQKVLLDPDMPMRAWDLVALGLDGHRFGMPIRSRKRTEAVDEMLLAVGAEHFARSRVGRLSGGEQQRVLIAHALISRPQLLLLDEPLANLDLRSSQEIVTLLGRIASVHGVAVVLSAHDINPLLPVMDKVVYIAGGRAASGTVGEVVRAEVLSQLYGHHVDVVQVGSRIVVIAEHEEPHHVEDLLGLVLGPN